MDRDDASHIGYSYSWEDENVVHLRFEKTRHSFGLVGRVLFYKIGKFDAHNQNCYDFIVGVGDTLIVNAITDNNAQECEINFIPDYENLYSRSKGLLEVGTLKEKRVLIIGLGSFGSQIAIELAKAGVGKFALVDFDRVELHNISRHTATLNDLGRLKTDVIYDSIKGKNPFAHVELFPFDITTKLDILDEQVQMADIIICATDNNKSRYIISQSLVKLSKIGIFGRAVTRAEGGDVFIYRPGGPCYACLLGINSIANINEEISDEQRARERGQIPAYMSDEQASTMVQVGLSADIAPICNMMEKLALLELSRGTDSGIAQLEEDFVFDYYIWANRREKRHINFYPMPQAGSKPTIMRWYGAIIKRNGHCPLCNIDDLELDEGEDVISGYSDFLNNGNMEIETSHR